MCPLGRAAGRALLWPGGMKAAHPLPAVTGPLFPILQMEAKACRGSGTQSLWLPGCRSAQESLGKGGLEVELRPSLFPSLLPAGYPQGRRAACGRDPSAMGGEMRWECLGAGAPASSGCHCHQGWRDGSKPCPIVFQDKHHDAAHEIIETIR